MINERCKTCEYYKKATDSCPSYEYCDGEIMEIIKNAMKKGMTNTIGKLKNTLYHKTFEEDNGMQKWEDGCWIRYKLFENAVEEVVKELEVD